MKERLSNLKDEPLGHDQLELTIVPESQEVERCSRGRQGARDQAICIDDYFRGFSCAAQRFLPARADFGLTS